MKDVLGDEIAPGGEAEFNVMIMGGVAGTSEKIGTPVEEVPEVVMSGTEERSEGKDEAPVAQGISGNEVLSTEEFWSDLQGFLFQRVRDQEVAEKALKVFRGAWGKET